ncbi:hypothetical protein FJZ39_02315 [Candidatus Saccharibacteria bacterium]|nr:hypothetical protein [Candidatus Saccharibacteria bacterium]
MAHEKLPLQHYGIDKDRRRQLTKEVLGEMAAALELPGKGESEHSRLDKLNDEGVALLHAHASGILKLFSDERYAATVTSPEILSPQAQPVNAYESPQMELRHNQVSTVLQESEYTHSAVSLGHLRARVRQAGRKLQPKKDILLSAESYSNSELAEVVEKMIAIHVADGDSRVLARGYVEGTLHPSNSVEQHIMVSMPRWIAEAWPLAAQVDTVIPPTMSKSATPLKKHTPPLPIAQTANNQHHERIAFAYRERTGEEVTEKLLSTQELSHTFSLTNDEAAALVVRASYNPTTHAHRHMFETTEQALQKVHAAYWRHFEEFEPNQPGVLQAFLKFCSALKPQTIEEIAKTFSKEYGATSPSEVEHLLGVAFSEFQKIAK